LKGIEMKTVVLSIMMMLYTFVSFGQSGDIVVEINGCENSDGVIQIGLYNSKTGFPEYDKSYEGVSLSASKETVVHTFTSIPAGTYAIAAWHDENEDKKINTNWIGIPSENYGFSQNKFGTFGPPDFEDVSFEVVDNKTITLTINLE
jgi:uncharacterized protein (DUF2141 family)